jgi:hypothetical protein
MKHFESKSARITNGAFLLLCAYVVADAASAVVARAVGPRLRAGSPAADAEVLERILDRAEAGVPLRAIADRNLLRGQREVAAAALGACTLPLVIRGALVAEAAPAWSLLVVADPRRDESRVASPRPGLNHLADGYELLAVDETGILVRHGQGLERCPGLDPATPAVTRPATERASPPGAVPGIARVGADRYVVDRSALEARLADLGALQSQARVAPETRQGRVAGVRLQWLRRGGVFAAIGLEAGDVLRSVNGLALTNPDDWLRALEQLRRADEVVVGLERNDTLRELVYTVRE